MNLKASFFSARPLRPLMCASWLLALALPQHVTAGTLPEQLIGATASFLEQSVSEYLQRSEIQARHEIQINRLDPRLRLAACDKELTVTLESPAQPIGRVTTRVRCEGHSPWTVFVPAQVRLFRDVVIITRPLKRNSEIGPADPATRLSALEAELATLERDVGLLNQGYLTDPTQVIGKKLTRAMQSDQVVSPRHLALAEVIRKGDQVVISARSSTVGVRMPGEALSDGGVGEQISVRNLRSNRVVKARVLGPGQVEVAM